MSLLSRPGRDVGVLAKYKCRSFDVGFESVFNGLNLRSVEGEP